MRHSRRSFLRTVAPVAALVAAAPAVARPAGATAWATAETKTEPLSGSRAEMARDEAFWHAVQQAFTIDRSLTHLNNGGVCAAPNVVQRALHDHLHYAYKVPFYVHRRMLTPQVEQVRQQLAHLLGCDAEELALTRNTSEGMAICQLGFPLQPGDEVLTTDQDYPRMLNTWSQRAAREGIAIRTVKLPVPMEDTDALVEAFAAQMTDRTRLVMLCHMIDLTGQVLPVRAICDLAHQRGIPVLVDAAQSVAHLDFTLADLDCDFLATSLHKWLMGPHGTGLLYVRRDRIRELWPLQPAAADRADHIRKFEDIGTQSLAPILAVSEAVAFHRSIGAARKEARLRYMRDYWLTPLLNHDRVQLRTSRHPAFSGGLATISVDGLDPVALRDHLWDRHRIIVRPIRHPSVEGIRVSPSLYTTLPELDRFVDVMTGILHHGLR